MKKIKSWQDLHHSLHDWECSEVFLKVSQHTAPVCHPPNLAFFVSTAHLQEELLVAAISLQASLAASLACAVSWLLRNLPLSVQPDLAPHAR